MALILLTWEIIPVFVFGEIKGYIVEVLLRWRDVDSVFSKKSDEGNYDAI
jgi:hypothetical protein